MTTRKKLIKKLDTAWAQVVKKGGVCVRCGKKENLQAAHIASRNYHSTRWLPLNGLALCAGCHFFAHLNPVLFTEFVKSHLGRNKFKQLKLQIVEVRKWSVEELESQLANLEAQLAASPSSGVSVSAPSLSGQKKA